VASYKSCFSRTIRTVDPVPGLSLLLFLLLNSMQLSYTVKLLEKLFAAEVEQ
jgi:hypothetical protein